MSYSTGPSKKVFSVLLKGQALSIRLAHQVKGSQV